MQREFFVLTAIGPDRPGLVDLLSGALDDAAANIEDSRMAVLGGEFAVILLGSGASGVRDTLRVGIEALERKTGLSISLRAAQPRSSVGPAVPCEIKATSLDHPGIVHRISHAVARLGANIESLETSSRPAPLTGTTIFTMTLLCSLPQDTPFSQFRSEIEAEAQELGVDLTLKLTER